MGQIYITRGITNQPSKQRKTSHFRPHRDLSLPVAGLLIASQRRHHSRFVRASGGLANCPSEPPQHHQSGQESCLHLPFLEPLTLDHPGYLAWDSRYVQFETCEHGQRAPCSPVMRSSGERARSQWLSYRRISSSACLGLWLDWRDG
jgi:hypothetical protein